MESYYEKSLKEDKKGRKRKAIEYLHRHLENIPEKLRIYEQVNLMGCYYHELFMEEGNNDISLLGASINWFEKALEIAPNKKLDLLNLLVVSGKLNDKNRVHKYLHELDCLGETDSLLDFERACYALKEADLKTFYKYYGARFTKQEEPTSYPNFPFPMAKDEDLTGKIVLVMWEQGFGDTILFSAYLDRLSKICEKIIFVCQDTIIDLMTGNNFPKNVMFLRNSLLWEFVNSFIGSIDYHLPIMDIPRVLNLGVDELCAGHGFLHLKEEEIEEVKRKYFNHDKIKIGVCFRGNTTGERTRDVDPSALTKLKRLKRVVVYNFTKGVKSPFINIAENCKTFRETANCVANCDFMICSDNVMLNLSAAIGKRTYGLFNWQYNFRYFALPQSVGWYDDIVTPLVCNRMNNWKPLIDQIIRKEKLN